MSIRNIVRHMVNAIVFSELYKIQDVVAKNGSNRSVEMLKVELIKNR